MVAALLTLSCLLGLASWVRAMIYMVRLAILARQNNARMRVPLGTPFLDGLLDRPVVGPQARHLLTQFGVSTGLMALATIVSMVIATIFGPVNL